MLGTEHLGIYVGLASGLDDLGPYGEMLQRSRRSALITAAVTGQIDAEKMTA